MKRVLIRDEDGNPVATGCLRDGQTITPEDRQVLLDFAEYLRKRKEDDERGEHGDHG